VVRRSEVRYDHNSEAEWYPWRSVIELSQRAAAVLYFLCWCHKEYRAGRAADKCKSWNA
jgi:hypothetical protein